MRAINRSDGITMAPNRIYDYPTIHALVVFLVKALDRKDKKSTESHLAAVSSLSVLVVLQQVFDGIVSVAQAEELLRELVSARPRSASDQIAQPKLATSH